MSNLLSSDDLVRVRREFAHDLVDLHPEVGPSATISAVAAAGGATIALTGLQTGTIARGTRLNVFTAGVGRRYTVTADVAIASHAATVAISPILEAPIGIGDTVEAVPDTSSVYNQIEGEQLFTDVRSRTSLAGRTSTGATRSLRPRTPPGGGSRRSSSSPSSRRWSPAVPSGAP